MSVKTFHVCLVVILSNYSALSICEATEMFVGEKLGPHCLTDPLQRGGEDGVGPPGLPPAAGHPGDPVRPRAHRHAEQRKTSPSRENQIFFTVFITTNICMEVLLFIFLDIGHSLFAPTNQVMGEAGLG